MPCRDYTDDNCNDECYDQQEKIDNLTRMLCNVMTYIDEYEESVQDNPDSDFHYFSSDLETIKGLLEWWNDHQAQDKARLLFAQQRVTALNAQIERMNTALDALDMEADTEAYNSLIDSIRTAKLSLATIIKEEF